MIAKKKIMLIFIYIFFISLFALILNIKTMPIINHRKYLVLELHQLKEKNKYLQFQIQQQTTFDRVQKKAEALGLVYPKFNHIEHILLPDN